jgi:hypothetical protein
MSSSEIKRTERGDDDEAYQQDGRTGGICRLARIAS